MNFSQVINIFSSLRTHKNELICVYFLSFKVLHGAHLAFGFSIWGYFFKNFFPFETKSVIALSDPEILVFI